MISLVDLLDLNVPFYLAADAYYANAPIIHGLLRNGNHLISRVKSNAVAYEAPSAKTNPGRGRPRKSGEKIRLRELFKKTSLFSIADPPVYGERSVQIKFLSVDLIWRSAGETVRFVLVEHPIRGRTVLMTTDLALVPIEVIRIYGLRFKIEVSFKQAVRTIGAYAYHFWMSEMKPIRRKSGDQYLHRETEDYRDAVKRKLDAYHRFTQCGLIAQGLLQYISCLQPKLVWRYFGSWMRTADLNSCPSEQVTAMALRNTFADFLSNSSKPAIFAKFIRQRLDLTRAEGLKLAG